MLEVLSKNGEARLVPDSSNRKISERFESPLLLKTYAFLAFLGLPSLAFAYLDPGSGNALVYLVVSLAGACVYFLKGAFYRVLGFFGKTVEVDEQGKDAPVILFSEGASYWFTFKPLIEELLKRKIPFQYVTLDVKDPALTIDDPLMQSRFLGYGAAAYARFAQVKGKLLIATTPNIGTEGYPVARPKRVEKMAFVAHMVSDISYLKKGSLDHYDVDLEIAPWCEERLRTVERIRGVKPKEVRAVGLLYLDEFARDFKEKVGVSDPVTVLVAPSWGQKGCLTVHGTGFITELLKAGMRVILRPHPQSFIAEPERIDGIVAENSSFSLFSLDREKDSRLAMRKADILISDSSSFRFDFAFLTKRPVVTLSVPRGNLTSFEADLLGGPWDEAYVDRLGAIVNPGESFDIVSLVKSLVGSSFKGADALYGELVVNHGSAASHIVDWLEENLASVAGVGNAITQNGSSATDKSKGSSVEGRKAER